MRTQEYLTACKRYLQFVLDQTKLTLTDVARRSGVDPSTLTRFYNGNPKQGLTKATVEKISLGLGIPLPSDLSKFLPSPAYTREAVRVEAPIPRAGDRDLPLQGSAIGGEDAITFNDAVSTYVERPWFLLGKPDAYAVYVHGDSMEPAYSIGQLLYVNPKAPAAPGNDVIVQTKDGRGLLKRLKRRAGGKVILEQFNPKREIILSQQDITAMHLVVAALKVRT